MLVATKRGIPLKKEKEKEPDIRETSRLRKRKLQARSKPNDRRDTEWKVVRKEGDYVRK